MIYGLTSTSFEIEIAVSPVVLFLSFPLFGCLFLYLSLLSQEYPLPDPPLRLSCDDVPDDVMEYASLFDPAICLEDGKSATFTYEETASYAFLSLFIH